MYCQHQNVHIPQKNQHAGNNPEVMGGISTVGSGLSDEIASPAISANMSKGRGMKELVSTVVLPQGKKIWVREMGFEKSN